MHLMIQGFRLLWCNIIVLKREGMIGSFSVASALDDDNLIA